MDPSRPRWRSFNPAQHEETQRCMFTAKNFLAAGELERCWQSLVPVLGLDEGAPGFDVLFVTATALRARQRPCLPWGDPNPYAVLGLIPTVPAARDPAVIESRYRGASDLLNRRHPNDPCWPAFTEAARLVTDAWDFLSDPDLKAFLDARYEAAATADDAAAVQPAPPLPNQPALPPLPNQPALLLLPPPPNQPELPPSPPPNQPAPSPPHHQPAPPPPPPHEPAPVQMGRSKRTKRPVKKLNL